MRNMNAGGLLASPPVRSDDSSGTLSPRAQLAFAPLHKRALGVATGTATGAVLFLITLLDLAVRHGPGSPLTLLGEYFAGYTVSVTGAFIILLWGFATGFVTGWFVAFCRNLVLAASIFWIRTRAELAATREFLDHI